MKWTDDMRNVKAALRKFGRKLLSTKRLLAIMAMGVCALFAVVVLYMSDHRLSRGPWHTYAGGLLSVVENRNDSLDAFHLQPEFRKSLESRARGKLLCVYQKSVLTVNGDVSEIRHINVFDIDHLYQHFFSSEAGVAKSYLSRSTPYFNDYELRRINDIDGHPAMAYKSRSRDAGGYFMMGFVVVAHCKAYFYECYSHYSPYADWQNDTKTYFMTVGGKDVDFFTVDDMKSIENRFLIYALLLFAMYVAAGALAHRSITRGIINQGPDYPIVNVDAYRRFQWLAAFTVVLMVVMLAMLVAFWQYRGAQIMQMTAYVALGLLIYSFNLPMSIHLHKKARGRTGDPAMKRG